MKGLMRLDELERLATRRRLDAVLVCTEPNIRALTGIRCDNAVLQTSKRPNPQTSKRPNLPTPKPPNFQTTLHTDFRYVPMVHRVAPDLACRDLKELKVRGRRIGYESSIPHAQFLALQKRAPRGATFVDVADDLLAIRAVKTPEEIAKVRAAEALTCAIWRTAAARFRAGMTERDMARIIQKLMIEKGEGEAFGTIVCVGKNAAECHHEPDDTVWDGREPVLVDMGVRLGGVCGDLTRNLVPGFNFPTSQRPNAQTSKPSKRPNLQTFQTSTPPNLQLYRQVYALVAEANRAAIAAARPGMTGRELDKVARDVIEKGGFGACFGHSLGHGVGYEIHEAPVASPKSKTVLKPGMCVTIEPGIYLEGNLGVRIEDLILITEDGCEVLSEAWPT